MKQRIIEADGKIGLRNRFFHAVRHNTCIADANPSGRLERFHGKGIGKGKLARAVERSGSNFERPPPDRFADVCLVKTDGDMVAMVFPGKNTR